MKIAWSLQARPVRAHRDPYQSPDPDVDPMLPRDEPTESQEPTPPMPKIPPRPLDWPPDAGVPGPDQSPAGSP